MPSNMEYELWDLRDIHLICCRILALSLGVYRKITFIDKGLIRHCPRNGFWTGTGGWTFNYPWHFPSIPLESDRRINTKTCALDDVFPPDNLCSGLSINFIRCFVDDVIYHRCIISNYNTFSVRDIRISRVGVAMTVCQLMLYCYNILLDVHCTFQLYIFNCTIPDQLYHNMNIGTM